MKDKKAILITGMPGIGKSTVAQELRVLGQEAYDLEEFEGLFEMFREGTDELFTDYDNADPEKIKIAEWRCDLNNLRNLIIQQNNSTAYYCATASNILEMFPLFEQVILLRVDTETLHARLSNREGTDDIGNTEEGRQAVLSWKDWWEDEMLEAGAVEVEAVNDSQQVAEQIISVTKL